MFDIYEDDISMLESSMLDTWNAEIEYACETCMLENEHDNDTIDYLLTESVKDSISAFFKKIIDFIKGLWDKVRSKVRNIVEEIQIKKGVDTIKQAYAVDRISFLQKYNDDISMVDIPKFMKEYDRLQAVLKKEIDDLEKKEFSDEEAADNYLENLHARLDTNIKAVDYELFNKNFTVPQALSEASAYGTVFKYFDSVEGNQIGLEERLEKIITDKYSKFDNDINDLKDSDDEDKSSKINTKRSVASAIGQSARKLGMSVRTLTRSSSVMFVRYVTSISLFITGGVKAAHALAHETGEKRKKNLERAGAMMAAGYGIGKLNKHDSKINREERKARREEEFEKAKETMNRVKDKFSGSNKSDEDESTNESANDFIDIYTMRRMNGH